MIIEKTYIKSGKFISFLWKPQKVFTELRQSPVIISPILIMLLLMVVDAFIELLFLNPATSSSTELGLLSQGLLINVISTAIIVLFTTAYVYLLYLFMKNKQRFKELLSIVLHAQLALFYIFIIFKIMLMAIMSITGQSVGALELTLISTALFFTYLGMGIKWGVNGTNRQFLIVLISYIALVIFISIALIVAVFWMLMALYKEVMNFLCSLSYCR